MVEGLLSCFIHIQLFTATFLRAFAQLAFLKGQEKEIREVLPRTGCKVEFMRSQCINKNEIIFLPASYVFFSKGYILQTGRHLVTLLG